jgi:hypothetical protein
MTKAANPSRSLLFLSALLLFLPGIGVAQITNLADTTATPAPGAGHHYVGLMNETVNPANGSVSVRINAPIPPGRKLTVPFSFAYDSNGAIVLQPGATGIGWTNQASWSYSIPTLTYQTENVTLQDGTGTVCTISINYMYADAGGGRHPLLLSTYGTAPGKARGATAPTPFSPTGCKWTTKMPGARTRSCRPTPRPSP